VQNLAKLFALLFLVAISYKQLVLCQMASALNTCLLAGDNDDEQDELEDLLNLVEQESLATAPYAYSLSNGFLAKSSLGFAYPYVQSCVCAPLVELHAQPPNKA
jgi:hypothetical protein